MAQLAVIGFMALSAASSVAAGFQQQSALGKQADQQRKQATLARQEANTEAARQEEKRDRLMATQRMAFASNGIMVTPGANSVMSVMDYTADQFNQEINAIRTRGAAQEGYYNTEASISTSQGRTAVLSGFTQAASTVANTAGTFA